MKKHNSHDSGYKKLFSNHEMVKQLLTGFVNETWVNEIEYSTLEKIDKSFISEEFAERESDLIYRAKFKNRDIYIFILLEFQSTVDRFMSLRMLHYILELYEDLIKNHKIKILPAVFPVMLYNGKRKWTSPLNISSLIERNIPKNYIPSFSYYKVSENEFSKDILLSIKNIISAVFYLENNNLEEIKNNIDSFINLIKDEKPEEIRLFRLWIKNYLHESETDESREIKEKVDDLKEVKNMLSLEIKRFKKKHFQLGVEKGIQEGELKKALETAKALLSRNMSLKEISEITGLSLKEIKKISG